MCPNLSQSEWPNRNRHPKLVVRARHDLFLVVKECDRGDLVSVAYQWTQDSQPGFGVPNTQSLVLRAGHESLIIRECETGDVMIVVRGARLSVSGIPIPVRPHFTR
jgi:hypothetical protein